jgi:ribonuclease J
VHRLQQAIQTAYKHDRKGCVVGRSMVNVITVANELGYMDIPEGILVELEEASNSPGTKLLY